MKKVSNKFIFLAFSIIIALIIYLIIKNPSSIKQVCFDITCFQVEIADDSKEQKMGLMNRQHLAQNQGMLFIFGKEDYYSFWMKNTLIPLDIIWIDDSQKIVDIESSVPPCESPTCPSYKSDQRASYVLEIPAGSSQQFGLIIGQKVLFK